MPEHNDPRGAGAHSAPARRRSSPKRREDVAPEVNAAIKDARALKAAQGRREQGRFLLEGVRLIEDAVEQGVVPELVFITPHLLDSTTRGHALGSWLRRQQIPTIEMTERLLGLVADTETPAGIVAVVALPRQAPALPLPWEAGLCAVVLDQVRDPGNVGAILRSAGAAGVPVVVATTGSVDLFAPKVVRAGAGAHFRLELFPATPVETVAAWLGEWAQVVLADGRAPTPMYEVDWSLPSVLVLSNEAHGAAGWLRDLPVLDVHIPMRGSTESLNVAAAAAILLYEGRREALRR